MVTSATNTLLASRSWRVSVVPTKPGSYREFRALAAALGVDFEDSAELSLLINRTPVKLALEINSGSVVGLTVAVTLEGPARSSTHPFIELTKETAADVEGKQRGINREVQIGDQPFDRAVYIDSDAGDDEVRRVLSKSTVRASALQLLDEHAQSLHLSPAGLLARWSTSFSAQDEGLFTPSRLVEIIAALLELAKGGAPRGPTQPRKGTWVFPFLLSAFFPLAFVTVHCFRRWPPGWLPALAGAGLGLLTTIALAGPLSRYLTGDSGAYRRYRASVFVLSAVLMLAGASTVMFVNAGLDASPPTLVEGETREVRGPDGDTDLFTVEIEWATGRRDSVSFSTAVAPHQRVTRPTHAGVLGFEWYGRVTVY